MVLPYPDAETLSGPLQTSKMEIFARTVNGFSPLIIIAKLSIVDVCRDPGYASVLFTMKTLVRCSLNLKYL